MSFKTQKAVFQEIIEETVGDVVNYDTVCQIQENLTELIEEHKEEPQPFKLQKSDVKKLLQNSGIKEEKLENFEQVYEETAGEDAFFQAANLVEAKSVAVKTPDVTIKVSPQRMDLVQIQLVEGRRCIVIPMEDGVQINGMNVTKMCIRDRYYNLGAVIGILTFLVLAVVSLITYRNTGSYKNEEGFQ